ncbi:transglycosylase domain-containing protein [Peribacillus loiseleuriae]|uniref:transglycosylase domain-containing protein n=1 Tax=Peribacillus loiseleuriae TaxID=1679170 RepID=UPI0038138E96
MKNNENEPISFWLKFTDFFRSKKTQKYSRVTYHVVWNILLLFIIVLVLGFSFAGGVGAGYFAALVKDEPVRSKEELRKDIYNYEEASDLYFADNIFLGKLKSDLDREEITIDEMSPHLLNAIVATEDEYFNQHKGVVPKAVMRAIFQEMTNASVQSGGSTLTQQLIKNQILTNEVSFDRKAKEILLALRLENFFTKDEILQTYLNVSTLGRNSSGQNIAGVQAAAKGIFGIEAKDLSIPQAAFIAGLPQSPFRYTPYTQKGELKSPEGLEPGLLRMKTVLKRMREGNYLTEQEYNDALNYDITKDFIGPKTAPSKVYPWLVVELEERAIKVLSGILAEQAGYEKSDLEKDKDLKEQYTTLARRELKQNNYKVYSTINKDMYDNMQKVVKNYEYFGRDKPQQVTNHETGEETTIQEPVETGAILIENKTGKILSFVGGRDFDREQTNHATTAKRPNGSTMKPLLVYAPAFELGYISPGSVGINVPISIRGWQPKNAGEGYTGLTNAREALVKSYNIPAASYYMGIINQRPATYLEKMGFTSLTETDYSIPSLALGAPTNGVTVEENVNAFTTFANDGQFIDAYMIDKIVAKDGKVIYQHKVDPVDVFSPQTAYLTLDIMRDVISNGTARYLNGKLSFSSDWAGKTGTTNNTQDAWFVATNPNVTFGTWIGYDTPKRIDNNYKGLTYSQRNIKLWASLVNSAYSVNADLIGPKGKFEKPAGIVTRSFCSVSGLLPSDACSSAGLVKTDLFNVKFVPSKVDNSFINGQYVYAGGGRYLAQSSTPSEFTSGGYMLNPEYLNKIGGKYITNMSDLISKYNVTGSALSDNGKAPAALTLALNGNSMKWNSHPERDVVGYRVYRNGQRVASIRSNETLAYSIQDGTYYVTAVDIVGKESTPSNAVTKQREQKQEVPINTTETREEQTNQETKPNVTPVETTSPTTPEPPAEKPAKSEN